MGKNMPSAFTVSMKMYSPIFNEIMLDFVYSLINSAKLLNLNALNSYNNLLSKLELLCVYCVNIVVLCSACQGGGAKGFCPFPSPKKKESKKNEKA